MSQGSIGLDPLEAFLSGRRAHPRQEVALRVEIGRDPWFIDGRAVNLSAGGVLVEVSRRELEGLCGRGSDLIAALEAARFRVRFAEAGFALETELVRLEIQDAAAHRVLLGCRFHSPLALVHQHRIGLEGTGDDDPGPLVDTPWPSSPFDDLPLEPRKAGGVSVLLFDESPAVLGPRFFGYVGTLGERTFTARLAETSVAQVSARLGTRTFAFRSVIGADTWAGRGTLAGARFVDVPGGAVEVAVVTDERPARRIRRAFRRRRA